ncbi:MAG: hypothetical protein Q4C95_02975 [Planctomycetia bacterium]|nr:hypothetical protein [Planctomycetia bacterium]
MLKVYTAISIICLTYGLPCLYAQDNSLDLKQYIIKNSTEIWKDYLLELNEGVEGRIQIQTFQDAQLENQYTCYLIREKKRCLEEIENPQEQSRIVNSFADGYVFKIHQQNNNPHWTIDFLEKISAGTIGYIKNYSFPTGKETNYNELKDYVLRYYLLKCFALQANTFLPTMLNLPEFVIESVDKVQQDDNYYYLVKFSFEPANDDSSQESSDLGELPKGLSKYPLILVRSGSLLLTTDYLLIKEADVNMIGGENRKIKCDYKRNNGFPLISEYSVKSYNNPIFEEKYHFDLHMRKNDCPSRFTLSHYGLPEPDFGENRVNRLRYVIMIAGLILIGFGVRRIYQKRREKSGRY